VLLEVSQRPLEEVLGEREEVLLLADDVLNLLIDRVGLREAAAAEGAAADAVGSNVTLRSVRNGKTGENGTSRGKRK